MDELLHHTYPTFLSYLQQYPGGANLPLCLQTNDTKHQPGIIDLCSTIHMGTDVSLPTMYFNKHICSTMPELLVLESDKRIRERVQQTEERPTQRQQKGVGGCVFILFDTYIHMYDAHTYEHTTFFQHPPSTVYILLSNNYNLLPRRRVGVVGAFFQHNNYTAVVSSSIKYVFPSSTFVCLPFLFFFVFPRHCLLTCTDIYIHIQIYTCVYRQFMIHIYIHTIQIISHHITSYLQARCLPPCRR